jgi:phosphatidylglycerophosphatase A
MHNPTIRVTMTDHTPLARPVRPTFRFMMAHPAHVMALGFGSGLSPVAPGTAGTLWAWLAFVVMQPSMTDTRWAVLIAASLPLGWWACTVTARNMRVLDPGSIVWDEIAAFWLVLWLVTPTGWVGQLLAFALPTPAPGARRAWASCSTTLWRPHAPCL